MVARPFLYTTHHTQRQRPILRRQEAQHVNFASPRRACQGLASCWFIVAYNRPARPTVASNRRASTGPDTDTDTDTGLYQHTIMQNKELPFLASLDTQRRTYAAVGHPDASYGNAPTSSGLLVTVLTSGPSHGPPKNGRPTIQRLEKHGPSHISLCTLALFCFFPLSYQPPGRGQVPSLP